jgi:hypothetical protein
LSVRALDSFLEHHVEKLVAGQEAPIDLLKVAEISGAIVEEREMIPEAAVAWENGGLRIYLQSNFIEVPGLRTRRRFSLAHEIAHTLFFEQRDGGLKPRRDAPIGDRLEAACHRGAGLLMVPTALLRKELRRFPDAKDAACIRELALRFDVSAEVILRRLDDLNAFGDGFAPILTRRADGGRFTIEFAVYRPWLKALLIAPRRGGDFEAWFGRSETQSFGSAPAGVPGEILARNTPRGRLKARGVDITSSIRIFELTLEG